MEKIMKKITIFQPNVTEKCCISEENSTLKGTQDNVHFEFTFFLNHCKYLQMFQYYAKTKSTKYQIYIRTFISLFI